MPADMARADSSQPLPTETPTTTEDWLGLLRVTQWIKNCFVLAPLLFSGRATDPRATVAAVLAFLAFCLLSSCAYVLNDIADWKTDRVHPVKRARPIAGGRIEPRAAMAVATILGLIGLALSFAIGVSIGIIGVAYIILNLLYTARLKTMVILDVFSLAAFFLLRLLAGAAAVEVTASVWLLLCGGLLALYLGFAKRRHELVLLGEDSIEHREVLANYSPIFLDQMSVVLLSVTIVSYIMYSLASGTAAEAGSGLLMYSTVFVLYGVFRYLYLVHERGGGSPTQTLLTDGALLTDVLLWLVYCSWVIYRPF